ncbi:MAG: enoyl-CoA hydratase/isomerase family protein [Polaromonas sp.]|nr:enoyl-CoA hydratase/isomerase family protein [Polaromonas sp.]
MFQTLQYEAPAPSVVRISLNRPETRNAQDSRLLYELNDAFDQAAQDDAVSVIILAANGPHFSSGHDLRESDPIGNLAKHKTVGTWSSFARPGAEGWMAREKELYLGLTERWRNLPKPTIAEVRGKCIAGGLMLVWPCDLIIASDDAQFCDNTVSMGVGGLEYFAHPWEFGARKAKELLFTADFLSAQEAHRLGMVNHVVAGEQLSSFVLEMATRIAQKPLFALKLAKEAVNAAQDAQGRHGALNTAFALHQLAHSHNMQVHGLPIDPAGAGKVLAKR